MSILKLAKTAGFPWLERYFMDDKPQVLKTTLRGCKAPLEEVFDFLIKYSELCRLVDQKLPGGDGLLLIRIASEGLRARLEGVNPDISSFAELCGVSRDKIRRTLDIYRDKNQPYSELKMVGRRKVFDLHAGISPNTAKILDEIVEIWQK